MILARRRRVVVLDPLDEYSEVAPMRAETLSDVLATIKDRWPSDFRIRYVPSRTVDPAPALDLLSAMLLSVQEPYRQGRDTRQITLAVDEMALAAPNVRKPSQGFAALCVRGRHWGIALVGTSQRMAEVSTTFRGNTQEDYIFPLRAAVDREAALKLIGSEYRRELEALKPHDCLVFRDGQITTDKNPPAS